MQKLQPQADAPQTPTGKVASLAEQIADAARRKREGGDAEGEKAQNARRSGDLGRALKSALASGDEQSIYSAVRAMIRVEMAGR